MTFVEEDFLPFSRSILTHKRKALSFSRIAHFTNHINPNIKQNSEINANLCLVFGAVALIVESIRIKKILLWLLVGLGSLGAYSTLIAYLEALPIVV